jgi:cell wall-associated NlpC family hydrolase
MCIRDRVHSHPSTSAKPTPTDLVGCESSGLPWLIYSLKTKEWCYFAPTGYRAPLIGRVFKHGVFDCYSAARDWYKEKLSLNLPDFEREDKWWEKGQNLFIDNFASAGFHPVEDGKPEYGDIILMNIGSPVVNHCAVYIGKDQIFHQTINRLSSREVYGGMWKKNTRLVLRYKK